ncbi:MAG: DUF3108 domain-containing protein [Elusimicrobiota bacterium]
MRLGWLGLALLIPSAAGAEPSLPHGEPVRITSDTVPSPYALIAGTLPYSSEYAQVPWFPESLEFEVKWGVFSMGFATMESKRIVDFGGQPAFEIVSTARSNRFADSFYQVRDINESWIRARDLSSLGYSKKLREGKFFRDEWVLFDYGRKSFLSKRVNRDGSFSHSAGDIPGTVQDILSSMYYIRPRRLEVGDEITLDVNTKENWPLVIKVLRKATVQVPAGRFRTVVVEPFLRKEGIFIQKGKRMRVWVTDDERHIPVLLKVEIVFGHISAYLTKIDR